MLGEPLGLWEHCPLPQINDVPPRPCPLSNQCFSAMQGENLSVIITLEHSRMAVMGTVCPRVLSLSL